MKNSSSYGFSGTFHNNVGSNVVLSVFSNSGNSGPASTVVVAGGTFNYQDISYISSVTVGAVTYNTYDSPYTQNGFPAIFFGVIGFDMAAGACAAQPVTTLMFTSDGQQSLQWVGDCVNNTLTLSTGTSGGGGGGGGGSPGTGPKPHHQSKTWIYLVIAVAVVVVLGAVIFVASRKKT